LVRLLVKVTILTTSFFARPPKKICSLFALREELPRMNPAFLVMAALAIGFASGLRAFTPLALSCWIAVWGWMPLGGTRLAFLGTNIGALIVSFIALGELVGDKLPITPSRTTAGPLGARIVTGALAGTALAIGAGASWIIGLLGGVIGSVAGAFAGYYTRRFIVVRMGVRDIFVALAEDLVTILLVLGIFAWIL
jgi:uncharacterized membrane protein